MWLFLVWSYWLCLAHCSCWSMLLCQHMETIDQHLCFCVLCAALYHNNWNLSQPAIRRFTESIDMQKVQLQQGMKQSCTENTSTHQLYQLCWLLKMGIPIKYFIILIDCDIQKSSKIMKHPQSFTRILNPSATYSRLSPPVGKNGWALPLRPPFAAPAIWAPDTMGI